MSDFDRAQTRDASRSAEVAHTAQHKAAEGADLIGANAGEVAGTAKDQAANTVNEVTAQARDLMGELRGQLQEQSRAQARQLAGNVRRLADELHEMSESGEPDSTASAAVRQVADSGRKAASYLESRGPEGIVEDLRGFARRKPGLFLAGAALAGFAAARLGKGVSAAGTSDGQGAEARSHTSADHRARTGIGADAGGELPASYAADGVTTSTAGGYTSAGGESGGGAAAGAPRTAGHPGSTDHAQGIPTSPATPAYPPTVGQEQAYGRRPEGD